MVRCKNNYSVYLPDATSFCSLVRKIPAQVVDNGVDMAKWVLITGGAVRIGKALSTALAAAGYAVCIHYNRSKDEAEALAAQVVAAGGQAMTLQAALNDIDSVRRLIPAMLAAGTPPVCLINNASLFLDDRLGALTPEGWDAHLAANLKAPIFLTQEFAAALPEGEVGSVINIIDQRVLRPNPTFFSYTVSKSALWAATKTMAQALAPRIRVNAIGPGPVLKSIHQSPEEFEREWRAMPLGRGAAPEELAAAVLFILRTPSLTGQMIALDGGQHLMWQTPDLP